MEAFLNKLKVYWILFSSIALAILYILYQRRGSKLVDLQREILTTKLSNQINDATKKSQENEDAYNKSLQKYKNLSNAYRKLTGNE